MTAENSARTPRSADIPVRSHSVVAEALFLPFPLRIPCFEVRKYLGISLALIFLLVQATSPAAEDYEVPKHAIAAATGASSAGPYSVTDITGQPCVAGAYSANYLVEAGFWSTVGSPPVPGNIRLTTLAGRTVYPPY